MIVGPYWPKLMWSRHTALSQCTQMTCLSSGVEWQGCLYVDAMLPFGLSSAPKLFNAVADGIEWGLRRDSVHHVFHYLNDFIVIGAPRSPECAQALDTLNRLCQYLGVPIAEHKRDGSTTCLTFLEIEIETMTFELRLPIDKLRSNGCNHSWQSGKAGRHAPGGSWSPS